MTAPRLKIHEIYRSIQGEGLAQGLPCTFVRLTGCDLRCRWCDTEHAFYEGDWQSVDDVLARVNELGADLVLLTGGEPLLQPAIHDVARRLLDAGSRVLLETGGHQPIAPLDPRVEIIMDLKCPGSGEVDRNLWENLDHLKRDDQVKLVIADRRDYEWARRAMRDRLLAARPTVLFSPVFGELDTAELAAWILEDGLHVRLGLQLHKFIWSPERRGV